MKGEIQRQWAGCVLGEWEWGSLSEGPCHSLYFPEKWVEDKQACWNPGMYFFAQKLFWEVQETEMRVWDVGSCLCDLLLWTERTGFSFRYIRWLIYLNCIVWHVLMYWWFCASTNAELRLCSPAEKPFWWKEDLHFCLTLLWTRCKNTRGWKTKIFLKWLFLTSSGDRQVVVVFRCSTGLTDFLEASTVQGASSSPQLRQENECEIFQSNLGFEICLTGMVGLWICAAAKAWNGSFV